MIISTSKTNKIYKKSYVNSRLFRKSRVYRRIWLRSYQIIRDYCKAVECFKSMGFTKTQICINPQSINLKASVNKSGFEIYNLNNGKKTYITNKQAEIELSERIRFNLGDLDEQEMTGYSSDPTQIGGP